MAAPGAAQPGGAPQLVQQTLDLPKAKPKGLFAFGFSKGATSDQLASQTAKADEESRKQQAELRQARLQAAAMQPPPKKPGRPRKQTLKPVAPIFKRRGKGRKPHHDWFDPRLMAPNLKAAAKWGPVSGWAGIVRQLKKEWPKGTYNELLPNTLRTWFVTADPPQYTQLTAKARRCLTRGTAFFKPAVL